MCQKNDRSDLCRETKQNEDILEFARMLKLSNCDTENSLVMIMSSI